MSSMSVDGLISGLNTTQLISQLMQLEARPQAMLKTSLSGEQSAIGALQSVNTSLASLQKAAESLLGPTAWQGLSVTSSSGSVAATATTASTTGSLTFDVVSTAGAQVTVSDPVGGLAATVGTAGGLDVTNSTGTTHIDLTDTSLAGVVSAVNAHPESGVAALAVPVGGGQYRLQLTAASSGAAAAFSVSGLAVGSAVATTASDASLRVGAGAGAFAVTGTSNTFSGLLPGVSFTVSQPATAVTVSTGRNPTAVASAVQALVTAANAAKDAIAKQTAVSPDGKTSSALTGDSTVRDIDTRLTGVGATVLSSGKPLSTLGVQLDANGKLTFDQTAFLAAYAADPAGTQTGIAELAGRFKARTVSATDPTTGSVSREIQSRNATVRDLNTRITDWDSRLADKQAALQAQFSAMEVALGTLRNQSSWLSSQLASLPTTTTSK